MSPLLQLNTQAGSTVLVEVDDAHTGAVTRGRARDAVIEAGTSIEEVLGGLGPALTGIVRQVRDAVDRPDEVQIEFAVKLSTDANLIIARAGGEANFRVALKWTTGDG